MSGITRDFIKLTVAAGLAAGAIAVAVPAAAQTMTSASTPTGLMRSASVTENVKVKSLDLATRHVIVTDGEGNNYSLKVPEEYRNFDQLKVGDTISATYTVSTEFVMSPPNSPLPPDTDTVVAARAAKGELPAAEVANHVVVTGAVIGLDMANHTMKLVSPQGGEVHKITVDQPDGRKAMAKLKVGDTITAYVTESLLVSTTPAN